MTDNFDLNFQKQDNFKKNEYYSNNVLGEQNKIEVNSAKNTFIKDGQFKIDLSQINKKNEKNQLFSPLFKNNRLLDTKNNESQTSIQHRFNQMNQQLSNLSQQQKSYNSNDTFLKNQENIDFINRETVKKTNSNSMNSQSENLNAKYLSENLNNNIPCLDNFQTIRDVYQTGKTDTTQFTQQLTNQSSDSQYLNKESLKSERMLNALEDSNKEISQKMIVLMKEQERLKQITLDNQEQNSSLQEKIVHLQKNNALLQENVRVAQASASTKQSDIEINELRKQELHKTIENLQFQLKNNQKELGQVKSKNLDLEEQMEQIIQQNERVLQEYEKILEGNKKIAEENNNLFQEKQNQEQDKTKKEKNLKLCQEQIEALKQELNQKNEMIKLLENEKIKYNKQLKQNEIIHLQSTIETEKIGIQLLEVQNQNEQLKDVNKNLQETLDLLQETIGSTQKTLQNLSTKHEDIFNEKEVLKNELSVTRESFHQNKSDLSSKISQLQEQNREYHLKYESIFLENNTLSQKINSLQDETKDLTSKLKDSDEVLKQNLLIISELNNEIQKEKDNSLLQEQKKEQIQGQSMQLAEVNQQLQLKLKEFQTKHQEQILNQQQLDLTISQQKATINNQAEQLKENQLMYNNLLKNNQETLRFNEDLQTNDTSKKVIEKLNQENQELIGKLNLILHENENLTTAVEKLEKQLKNKIEEIDIKKKLLLQFQKENENFRNQVNTLPQPDRVEQLLDTQKGQNQQLLQRVKEREKEICMLNKENEEIRIKLIKYQQKEQLLLQEDEIQQQNNNFKLQINQLEKTNSKLQSENEQLYDLLKLRKQEILMLTEKLEKKVINTNQGHKYTNSSNKNQ